MSIVLKREAKQHLETMLDEIDFLFIDGTLQHENEKVCGCCGPPPSPDYKIKVFKKNESQANQVPPNSIEIEKLVKFRIDKQLHDAIVAARMNIVVFFLETTGSTPGQGTL